MKVKRREENIGRYREEMARRLEEKSRVEKVQTMAYVHICNMDSLTTEEEIIEEIMKETGIGREDLKVTLVRPAYGESQVATVKLPKDSAVKIARARKIMIGYVACRVYIREFEERCYTCGEIGHVAGICERADRVGKCFRCREEGYYARACEKKRAWQVRPDGKERENREGNRKEGQERGEGRDEEKMQEVAGELFEDAPNQF